MLNIYRTDLSLILNDIAELVDISTSEYENATLRYQAVGRWLGEGNSPLAAHLPTIYPQGSFELGTVTKIWGKDDEYDLDLIFELNLSKEHISQQDLKNLIGDRLRESDVYKRMLDAEGRRCWTIVYSNGAKFHLDILPAIPNVEFRGVLKSQGIPEILAGTGIAITDVTHPNYRRINPDWPSSNPKGYAAWFRMQMATQFEAVRKSIAATQRADIQDVPEFQVKTTLQRSVQLIKRHRDITFEKKDDKPATIILTTLAALSYNNELDLFQAVTSIANEMPTHITTRDAVRWVQNPVNPMENFADRWQDPEHPYRESDFANWHGKLVKDLEAILASRDVDEICELLIPMFGEKATVPAIMRHKDRVQKIPASTITAPTAIRAGNKPWGQ